MKYTHPVLKPLFMAIARLPLIGPHGDQDMELLRSGAKPVGIFNAKWNAPEIDQLQHEVEADRLIRLDIKQTQNCSYQLYGWHDVDIDEVGKTYEAWHAQERKNDKTTESDRWQEYRQTLGLTPSWPEGRFKKAFYEATFAAMHHVHPVVEGLLDLERRAKSGLVRLSIKEFLEGTRRAFIMPDFEWKQHMSHDMSEQLKGKMDNGLIQCRQIDCIENSDIVLFGQPGQERNMDDLAFILRHAHEKLENNTRGITRQTEGQILGYSDRDIDFFQNRLSFNRLQQLVLDRTHAIRRDIRIGLMKEMGPQWPRNP